MPSAGKFAPAFSWRAFFVSCLLGASMVHAAVPVKPPELAQIGLPDEAEAKKILEDFRQSGIPGAYFFELELHGLPRRGEEVVYHGRLWGSRNDQGAITRVELVDGAGKISRLLVQNGEHPALWRFVDGKTQTLSVAASFEPLIAGLEITAFDLQMPFLYWPNAKLERIDRVRGRPAHVFVFPAPAGLTGANPAIATVRASLDAQYHAFMQIEYRGASGLLKTISLVDLKKVGDQWIPKSFDVRNDVSRDKTRFLVTGAALNLDLAPAVFAPAALGEAMAAPADKLVRIEP